MDSAELTLLIVIILVLSTVALTADQYLLSSPASNRFKLLYVGFCLSVLLLVISVDLVLITIALEIIGITSLQLISHLSYRGLAVLAGLKAVVYTKIGDIGLMVAAGLSLVMFMLYSSTAADVYYCSGIIMVSAGLAALTKSAVFPAHGWLVDAMEGPTPASSLIHAATLVLAGIILFDKTGISDVIPWSYTAIIGISVLSGSLLASMQLDVKRALAYSTSAHISLCAVTGIIGSHVTTHAFFKSGCFILIAAVLIMQGGYSRDSRDDSSYGFSLPVMGVGSVLLFNLGGLVYSDGSSKEAILFWLYEMHNSMIMLLLIVAASAVYCTSTVYEIASSTGLYTTRSVENGTMSGTLVLAPIVAAATLMTDLDSMEAEASLLILLCIPILFSWMPLDLILHADIMQTLIHSLTGIRSMTAGVFASGSVSTGTVGLIHYSGLIQRSVHAFRAAVLIVLAITILL